VRNEVVEVIRVLHSARHIARVLKHS
jgi:hypothetical protein